MVVGGGAAGLSCALHLMEKGCDVAVLEASDGPGGRIRTDLHEGFLLDRGFQVLLTSYPECQRLLDLPALAPGAFRPGALVRYQGAFHRLADPFRDPRAALASLRAPFATLRDKLKVASLRRRLVRGPVDDLFLRPEKTTLSSLREHGFSTRFIDAFFRPFLGGIFLESGLETSSRMFEFVLRMFSQGEAVLPSRGMQAIPEQLAGRLPRGSLRLECTVAKVSPSGVRLRSGEDLEADAVVLAVPWSTLSELVPSVPRPESRSVTCLYFEVEKPPLREPILVLDGEGRGPINNLCFPSQVVAGYAPPGKSLLSVTVLGDPVDFDEALVRKVREQLEEWYGSQVSSWRPLRTYRICHALPAQPPGSLEPLDRTANLAPGLFACGDHRQTGSLQGALSSGRLVAGSVLRHLSAGKILS